ncbi:MAG: 50S ribosomal protein L18, partial [archaeon]
NKKMKVMKVRRRENKTDYLKRLNLLKSKTPRIVFRKTNKYIISQYVRSKSAQDTVEIEVNSKRLLTKGWPKEFEGSLKSIPASYLTGYLMGFIIKQEKKESPIVDFGMIRVLHKTKIYAFLKGLKDAGIEIECSEEFFPEEEKIKGKNLKKDFSKHFQEIKTKIEK